MSGSSEGIIESLLGFLTQYPITKPLIVATSLVLVVLLSSQIIKKFLGQHVDSPERRYRLRKMINILGYLMVVFVLSIAFQKQLGGLSIFMGVAVAGVAFALQEIILSAGGWVTMAFGRFYTIGDRIQLGGTIGDVIDIGMLRTTLMECGGWIDGDQYNGRVVRVANSAIFKEPVFNYSADFPFLWDEIILNVKFGSDYEFVAATLLSILEDVTGDYAKRLKSEWRKMTKKYMLEDARLMPMVTRKMGDNWVVFSLRYVVDYKQRRSTKDDITARILKTVEASEGKVQLGAPSLEISAWPKMDVGIESGIKA